MRSRNWLLLSCFFTTFLSSAQVQIGYYHDLEGQPIHGTVDPFEYTPIRSLRLAYNSSSFEKGTVYNQGSGKVEGLIHFENKKIWFKASESDKKYKLKPDEIQGFTIGVDSFFVTNNFYIEKEIGSTYKEAAQFMQYLTSYSDLIFAKHYNFTSDMAQTYGFASPKIETYQVRRKGESSWTSFPKSEKKFKEVALTYFGHLPYLKQKIADGSLGANDVMTLIKSAEFYDKFKNFQPAYFDAYWNETTKDKAFYQAHITSLEKDSIWTIEYTRDNHLLYRAQFYSLFPFKRHGLFECFGEKRQLTSTAEYKEDKLLTRSLHTPSGKTKLKYSLTESDENGKPKYEIAYQSIVDENGENTIKTDSWSAVQGEFTVTYSHEKLTEAYRIMDGIKVYQVTHREYDFGLSKLQGKLNTHFEASKFPDAVKENAQGEYFITVLLSDKGKVVDYEVHNSVHPEVDEKIRGWAALYLGKGTYASKFKKYKVNNEKVFVEFMIPLQFSVNKFFRRSSNYYYDWGFHHMMMHQQMMMQPMNLPSPPPPPGRF